MHFPKLLRQNIKTDLKLETLQITTICTATEPPNGLWLAPCGRELGIHDTATGPDRDGLRWELGGELGEDAVSLDAVEVQKGHREKTIDGPLQRRRGRCHQFHESVNLLVKCGIE